MAEWSAIVPIRGWESGKSRLGRPGIARAMALDTVRALLDCPDIDDIVIVTSDRDVQSDFSIPECTLVDDHARGDLNRAIAEAADHRRHKRCIVLLGDLPSITPSDIAHVLARCGTTPHFVSDARGTGSTMWLTDDGPVHTYFGERSCARHRASGAVELGPRSGDDPFMWARVRRDVDDIVDLDDAVRLGVGQHTAAVLENDGGADPSGPTPP